MLTPNLEQKLRLALHEGLSSLDLKPELKKAITEAQISELRKIRYNNLWWGEPRPKPEGAPEQKRACGFGV
jgi:hypothetical protein